MRLPRKIETLIRQKEAFLEDIRNRLERSTIRLQGSLFEDVVENIIPRITVSNGVIEDTAENYKLVSEMDKLFNSFNGKVIDKLVPQISKGIEIVVGLNNSLMLSTFVDDLPARFEKVAAAAKKITDLRLGLQGGKLVRGGFLASLMKTDPTELQKFISQAVSSQMTMKEFIKGIKVKINGDEQSLGYMERKFQRFAYDTYQQYDASYNKSVADEFGMKYFVYSGGLIKDSRDFCAAHNNKVFTTKEAETWTTWAPAEGERNNQYPAGYEIKAKVKTDVPSYLGYPGYDPLVDRGGYNCRHILAYIPEHFAFKYRPDLKEGKKEVKEPEEQKEINIQEAYTGTEFIEAKTIKEAERYAKESLNIPNVNFKGLANKDVSIANEMNKSIKYHLDKYPYLKETLNFVGTSQGHYELEIASYTNKYKGLLSKVYSTSKDVDYWANVMARRNASRTPANCYAVSYSGDFKGIAWNSKYKLDAATKLLKKDVAEKFHPIGTDNIKSVMDHEIGHRMDELLILRKDEYITEIIKDSFKKGLDYTKNNLSAYAYRGKNPTAEFIAEAWSEYLNNPAPREIAKKIGEYIEKDYKNQFIKTLGK